jgi:hypothetical protein
MTDNSSMLAVAKMADEIVQLAIQATDSYFLGQDKTKRTIRGDMEELRSALRAYAKLASACDTTTIIKGKEYQ